MTPYYDLYEQLKVLKLIHNGKITQEQIENYSKSNNKNIRASIASCENTPIKVLELLSNDIERRVREYICLNINCTEELLRKLAETELLIENVLRNDNCPEDLLVQHSNSKNYRILDRIAIHPKTPIHILKDFLTNNDREIRSYAKGNLIRRGVEI